LVWSAAHALPAGSRIARGDLRGVAVSWPTRGVAAGYLSAAGAPPIGYLIARPVGAGELLPRAAIQPPGPVSDRARVTVPVSPVAAPADLARGDRVDVWVTTAKDDTATDLAQGSPTSSGGSSADSSSRHTVLVVLGAVVDSVDRGRGGFGGSGSGGRLAVVLSVHADEVARVVAAPWRGDLSLVGHQESGPAS
ncbi:MAG: SAF domain-containing protein, partial [Actinomycetes bacterium]